MNAIVAVDVTSNNWGIGYQGKLLYKIKEDLNRFRTMTVGKVVVYGRKTLESFPNKKPLPDRINIILSKNKNFKCEGATVIHSVRKLMKYLDKHYNSDNVFVIGGQSVYEQLLPYCDRVYVTKIIGTKKQMDAFFPSNLDYNPMWFIESSTVYKNSGNSLYSFVTYQHKYTKKKYKKHKSKLVRFIEDKLDALYKSK